MSTSNNFGAIADLFDQFNAFVVGYHPAAKLHSFLVKLNFVPYFNQLR